MIITLVGSSRFPDAFALANMHLSAKGHIVLSIGCFGHADEPRGAKYLTNDADETNDIKQALDEGYRKKIAMSDAIYVINPCNYLGQGSYREIRYAEELGKDVYYMFGDNL